MPSVYFYFLNLFIRNLNYDIIKVGSDYMFRKLLYAMGLYPVEYTKEELDENIFKVIRAGLIIGLALVVMFLAIISFL